MATTLPFKFPLPDCFVDIEKLSDSSPSTKFETRLDNEWTPIEARLIPADVDERNFFFCLRFRYEPFWRAEPEFHWPSRSTRPTHHKSNHHSNLKGSVPARVGQDRTMMSVECSRRRFIFLVDTKDMGGEGRCWLYMNDDLRSGNWFGFDDPSKSGKFYLETNFSDVVEAMEHSDSDVRFALRWMHLSLEMQRDTNTFYANGDEAELRQIVRAIALHEWDEGKNGPLIYRNGFLDRDWRRHMKVGGKPPRYRLPYPAPNLRLEMWGKHVRNYFQIHGDAELMRKHQWLDPIYPEIVIECSTVSQHERLEAALLLLYWAKERIPPNELRILIPTL